MPYFSYLKSSLNFFKYE
jgi:solute carrier family 25 iron transporter 28/37